MPSLLPETATGLSARLQMPAGGTGHGSHANTVGGKCLRQHEGGLAARDPTDPVFASSEAHRVVAGRPGYDVSPAPRFLANAGTRDPRRRDQSRVPQISKAGRDLSQDPDLSCAGWGESAGQDPAAMLGASAGARLPRNSGLCPWAGIHLLSNIARLPILARAAAGAHLLSRNERSLLRPSPRRRGRPRSQTRRWRISGAANHGGRGLLLS